MHAISSLACGCPICSCAVWKQTRYPCIIALLFILSVCLHQTWSLFCPHECPGLMDSYGDEFDALYERYEKERKAHKSIKARALWAQILESQVSIVFEAVFQSPNRPRLERPICCIKTPAIGRYLQ